MSKYTINRNQASKILNMSTRTIDRYIAKKIFSVQKVNGRILFSEKEISDFLAHKNTEVINTSSTQGSTYFRHKFDNLDAGESVETFVYNHDEGVESGESTPVESVEVVSKSVPTSPSNDYHFEYLQRELETKMYKHLYETTQQIFQSQQENLKTAYLKIGQLEAELKNSSYLLENKNLHTQIKENEIKQQLTIENKQELEKIAQEKNNLQEKMEVITVMKYFYLITTIISIFIFSLLIV